MPTIGVEDDHRGRTFPLTPLEDHYRSNDEEADKQQDQRRTGMDSPVTAGSPGTWDVRLTDDLPC
jgi:hypothetical protein